jgi:hypothetical protein
MDGPRRNLVSKWLAAGIGLALLATVAALTIQLMRRPKPAIDKVVIGTNDGVYYSRGATMQQAADLGHALEKTGFFNDRGTSVLLSKNKGLMVVSFVLNEGAWDHADAMASFEEIGRRIANSIGGFPIEVRLVDSAWSIRRSLAVGKVVVGNKDAIYYLGSATEGDAIALGRELREAGYLEDLGASVVLAKDGSTALGFVVGEAVWERPDAVAGFERLARRVAGPAGGLPIQLRLLNGEMEIKREVVVR